MSASKPRATLIVNPTAGRGRCGRAIPRIRQLLGRRGLDAAFLFTSRRGDGERLAAEAIATGADLVAAVGGDGTLHEVANALLTAGRSDVTLGLIPFGTGNDFARAVGLYGNLDAACQALTDGNPTSVDVGLVEGVGIPSPYYFLVAAGVGFVADTAKTVNEGIRWLHGAPAYIWGALSTLRRFAPMTLILQSDEGEPQTVEAMLVSVSNVATTGGGMRIAPQATPFDGSLDVCLVRKIGKMELAGQLPGVFRGSHVRHPAVSLARVKSISIKTDKPAILWIDGEIIGTTPASFRVVPSALSIMRPSAGLSGQPKR